MSAIKPTDAQKMLEEEKTLNKVKSGCVSLESLQESVAELRKSNEVFFERFGSRLSEIEDRLSPVKPKHVKDRKLRFAKFRV